MTVSERNDEGKGRGRLWRYLPLALVLLGSGAFFSAGLYRSLSLESLIRHHDGIQHFVDVHPFAAMGGYVLAYIAIVTFSIPASAFLTTLGGYVFGWALGGSLAAVAATAGATGIFLVARTSLGELLQHRAGKRAQMLAEGFRRHAFSSLLFLRLLPIVPFWVTNLAAALFGMPLRTFVLATQLGVIPITFAFAMAGSGLDRAIARQSETYRQCLATGAGGCGMTLDLQSLLTTELVIALAVLSILALSPILFRWWQGRKEKQQ